MPSTKYAIAILAVRMDTESMLEDIRQIRRDRATPVCEPGNKLCGKRCLPEGQNCGNATAVGVLKGVGHGTLALLGPVGAIANAAIGASTGGGKGAVKAVAKGLLGPVGGGVYGGLRARGHGRGSSGAAGIAASLSSSAALGLGIYGSLRSKGKTQTINGIGGSPSVDVDTAESRQKAKDFAYNFGESLRKASPSNNKNAPLPKNPIDRDEELERMRKEMEAGSKRKKPMKLANIDSLLGRLDSYLQKRSGH